MLKIVQAPNPVLSQQAKPVNQIDKSIRSLTQQMKDVLENATDPEGVGLAAPQVGKSLQIFIIRQTPRSPYYVFINPVLEKFFDAPPEERQEEDEKSANGRSSSERKKGVQLEGCLSLYSVWGVVKRRYGVVVSYLDENGTVHKKKFEGFMATIIQHEYDHLQGILFPKRVLEQQNQLFRSSKNEKGEIEFEEIEL